MYAQEALSEVLLNKGKAIWQGRLRICLTRLGSYDNAVLHQPWYLWDDDDEIKIPDAKAYTMGRRGW
ncbi:hypothetical protein VTN02DRAFT_324 [Thermoascus thermophilus]